VAKKAAAAFAKTYGLGILGGVVRRFGPALAPMAHRLAR
jgi:hypothetical protein